jgi:hypothetical protein
MARSKYIYIVTFQSGDPTPIGAGTVKGEIVEVLSRMSGTFIADLEVWRLPDGLGLGTKVRLGTADEFLAKERP